MCTVQKFTRLPNAFIGYRIRCSCVYYLSTKVQSVCGGCHGKGWLFCTKKEIAEMIAKSYTEKFSAELYMPLMDYFIRSPEVYLYYKSYDQ